MTTNKNITTVMMKNCIGVNGIKLDESAAGMPVKFTDRVIGYIKQVDAAFVYINLWTSNWGIVYNNTSNELMELSLYTPSLEVNLADPLIFARKLFFTACRIFSSQVTHSKLFILLFFLFPSI